MLAALRESFSGLLEVAGWIAAMGLIMVAAASVYGLVIFMRSFPVTRGQDVKGHGGTGQRGKPAE